MPQFYKMLAGDLRHYDFTYKEGLNVDHLPFDPSGDCKPGGLYYTTLEFLPNWYNSHWPLIAEVTIPDGACVYEEACETKWKADRLVLSNIRPLEEFFATLDEYTLRCFITVNVYMLKHVLSEAVCLAVVKNNWSALAYVKQQTEPICLAAVQNHGNALCYVENQTEAICRAAVAQTRVAYRFVKIPIWV